MDLMTPRVFGRGGKCLSQLLLGCSVQLVNVQITFFVVFFTSGSHSLSNMTESAEAIAADVDRKRSVVIEISNITNNYCLLNPRWAQPSPHNTDMDTLKCFFLLQLHVQFFYSMSDTSVHVVWLGLGTKKYLLLSTTIQLENILTSH